MQYTADQLKVISLHNRNLLVAAAAGAGKTAVLVERIIRMLLSGKTDIDRLLVVTFTKAAAAEMKERIGLAIKKELSLDPDNEHLQKQDALLHHAKITTIDSFCQSVLSNHFEEVGVDPAFRVADENEIRLMKGDIISELLEERFAKGQEEFELFAEVFRDKGNGNAKMEEIVEELYNYAVSFPWPLEWLEHCTDAYRVETIEELNEQDWMKEFFLECKGYVEETASLCQNALEVCLEPDGPVQYEPTIQAILDFCEELSGEPNYSGMSEVFANKPVFKLSASRQGDGALRKKSKSFIDQARKLLEELEKKYFCYRPENVLQQFRNCRPIVEMLKELTIEFYERFSECKKEKNLVDFSDLEHYALQIFLEKKDGVYVPTQTALEYRNFFEEIMIDEYQDSNLVQELLLQSISREDEGCPNRFMVGDVKQSIYRFRLARPELFLEKYEKYSEMDSTYQKIDLHKNFRSRKEVLDTVNELFYVLMRKEVGHINYDEQAALNLGANYPSVEDNPYRSELLRMTVPKGNYEATERVELEAEMVGQRIKEMVGIFQVTDRATNPDNGQTEEILRPASYRDIVILLRSTKDTGETYRKVFEKMGIPAYVTTRTGYFSSREVQTVFNFLKILDNPLQEIALYGAMLSEMFAFTEEEMARIKLSVEGPLFRGLQKICEADDFLEEQLTEKVRSFMAFYGQMRECMRYTPIHELIRSILRETGYDMLVQAMPGGERRKANLDALIDKAVEYEKTSFHGLFHFMRYIENLKKYEIDYGEADVMDESSELVRIMTIHNSKGLEFPICFVVGTGRKFNTSDEKKEIARNASMGIAMDEINRKEGYRKKGILKNIIMSQEKAERMGEELRVLYVALTRAKEKLIIAGVTQESGTEEGATEGTLSCSWLDVLKAQTFLEWIDRALKESVTNCCMEEIIVTPEQLIGRKLQSDAEGYLQKEAFMQDRIRINEEWNEELKERFAFQYPYKILKDLYTKTSVSELKIAALEEKFGTAEGHATIFPETSVKTYVPKFRREEEVSGTETGSSYHRVFELLNYQGEISEEGIRLDIAGMLERGAITQVQQQRVNVAKILTFRRSDIGMRMAKAAADGLLYREQPFVLGLPASRLKKEFPEEEQVLIQGIIDAFFEEDGEIVVVDYKTDRVSSAKELAEKYRAQIDYYTEAIERLTHKRVKEKILYSTALGKSVYLD